MNSITLTRGGKKLYPLAWLSDGPVQAGIEARAQLDLWRPLIQRTDVLHCNGTVDFGSTHTLLFPECHYEGPAMWLTHCKIDQTTVDGVVTKPSSCCGFSVGRFAKFRQMRFGGDCVDRTEDGGLIGFAPELNEPAEMHFEDCDIDGSQGMDWTVYGWRNNHRSVLIQGGTLRFCRIGVALAASGAAAQQTVILDGVRFVGDANGSTSYGESSGGDVNTGGVLTAVLNRSGSTTLRDCTVEAIGLTKPYNPKWGCPRIAALCTNQYYSGAGATSFTVERCKVNITPGISQAVYDIDVRGSGKLSVVYNDEQIQAAESAGAMLVAEARGGSGENGELKVWKP